MYLIYSSRWSCQSGFRAGFEDIRVCKFKREKHAHDESEYSYAYTKLIYYSEKNWYWIFYNRLQIMPQNHTT